MKYMSYIKKKLLQRMDMGQFLHAVIKILKGHPPPTENFWVHACALGLIIVYVWITCNVANLPDLFGFCQILR